MKHELKICGRCKGTGRVWEKVNVPRNNSAPKDAQCFACPQIGCHNGICDPNEFYESWRNIWTPEVAI